MNEERLRFLLELVQNELNLGRGLEYAKVNLKRGFPPEEVDAAVFAFMEKQNGLTNASTTILRDIPEGSENSWYGQPRVTPGCHWQLLQDVLTNKKHWTEQMLRSLDDSSSSVMANIASPYGSEQQIAKGLVLGYVQSGKTANFSAVIAKAVDAGYKLVIVLAGIHNNLRFQTEKRLYKEICEPDLSAVTNLTEVDELGDFKKRQTVKAERACGRSDGFSMAILKKNATVLRNFDFWLSEARSETLVRCPTLIIDDESDHASINTAKPENDPTAINDLIRTILRRFGRASFVGYTATPFANILIDSNVEDDLYPRDFLISLPKPSTYFGAEELFGSGAMSDSPGKSGLPVIRTVPIDEANGLTKRKQGNDPANIELGSALKNAVNSFILAGAIRIARGHHSSHITMLVHTSHLTSTQGDIFEKLKTYVEDLKLTCRDRIHEDFRNELIDLYNKDFLAVSILENFKSAKSFPFSTIEKNVGHFLSRIELILDNSTSEPDERLNFERESPLWGIVIGGNTLSRGLTIEGLTTSYYVRDSKGYDTLLQMGRWFGYRPDFVDLTRVYLTEELQKKFFHLSTVEEEMRIEIHTMAENRERPVDVALRIRCHPGMVVTSNLKARNAKDTFLTFSGTKLQARSLNITSESVLRSNIQTINRLFEQIKNQGNQSNQSRFKDFSSALLFRKVPAESILQFLDGYQFSMANVKFSSQMIRQYVNDMVSVGELSSWSVAVMSNRTGRSLQIPTGDTVFKVERSIIATNLSERDADAVYLTALSPPEDEMIDLDDIFPNSETSVEKFLAESGNQKRSTASIRQSLRPVSRGLLILYPLDNSGEAIPKTRSEPSELDTIPISSKLAPLKTSIDVFGVTIVFPKSKNARGNYRYIVNGTV